MGSPTNKRVRLSADEPFPSLYNSTAPFTSAPISHANASSSSFRNVSACNRCRVRKNRCDQNLPACSPCEKAGVKCVGFDPITKREIPRTYVYYLESRVTYLESLLSNNGIPYAPSQEFDLGAKPMTDQSAGMSPPSDRGAAVGNAIRRERSNTAGSESGSEWEQKHEENEKITKLVSNIGMVSVQGASDPRYLGSTSGISFARVVFAAIKSTVSDKNGGRASKPGSVGSAAATSGTSMRDSFFGLQSKPTIKPAPFPDRDLGMRLVNLYFEHANPQIPILHRGEFMILFGRAYQSKDRQRSARELYMLNIVFAIGAGIILEDSSSKRCSEAQGSTSPPPPKQEPGSPNRKKMKMSSLQRQPEEYHASAMMQLESFLGSMPSSDRPEGFGGGLEQLQAVLLLAGFALLRPVAPGLWYITGVAVRLGVDLGLHYEDGAGVDDGTGQTQGGGPMDIVSEMGDPTTQNLDPKVRGRREWVRDLRRRLWWCVYSFDRLVSTCVGRPFGIPDQVITTDWPSILDDKDITPEGFLIPSHNFNGPSYKRVAHHYFRLRLLQSEILQVLQHRQAKRVHEKDREQTNRYMHTTLPSSFLQPFGSFNAWRKDIDRRLWEWKESAPLQQDTTVKFSVKFLELNYWQAVILLYRQTLSVPPTLAGETSPNNDIESPMTPNTDDHEDEDDIFLKVAEAGQRVLKLYRQLHKEHVVNYTYLATVHLFMAGIGFLYSIWHSPTVRSRLTIQDVDYTVLAGTTVLTDLMEKCPPAESCRDAFQRMSKATITMCNNTTGFGSQVRFARTSLEESPIAPPHFEKPNTRESAYHGARPPPQFDYNLGDLFPDKPQVGQHPKSNPTWQFPLQNPPSQLFNYPSPNSTTTPQQQQQQQQQYDPRLLSQTIPPLTVPSNGLHNPTSTSTSTPTPFPDWTTTIDFTNTTDFDFLMSGDNDPTGTYTGDSGLNLGFEAEHDFTDGPLVPDMFGGYFFGGLSGEMNPGGEGPGFDMAAAFGGGGGGGGGGEVEALWGGGGGEGLRGGGRRVRIFLHFSLFAFYSSLFPLYRFFYPPPACIGME